METKYTLLDGKAYMFLNKHIGPNENDLSAPYIDGGHFASEMYRLKSEGYDIIVKINSPGGRVDHGWSIVDAIKTTGASTHIIGLAASMAGICFMYGKRRYADDHATLMLHAPKGSLQKYIDIIKDQFTRLLVSVSKVSKQFVENMMKGGDYFFDVSQMKEYGFVDDVIRTGVAFVKPTACSTFDLYNAYSCHLDNRNNSMAELNWIHTILHQTAKVNELRASGASEYEILARTDPGELNRIALEDPETFSKLQRDHIFWGSKF